VLESQTARIDKSRRERPLLEAQVVDAADSMTYDAHDSDDAVKLGLVKIDELLEVPLVRECADRALALRTTDSRLARKVLVRDLIDHQVSDLLRTASAALASADLPSAAAARESAIVLGPSAPLAAKKTALEAFLYERVYRHEQIIVVRENAGEKLRELFAAYLAGVDRLPLRHRSRCETVGPRRAIADFLAGMTEGYFLEQHAKITSRVRSD
jgi:dGTPase